MPRQAAEIQRLKEDVERERDFNEARKFNPSQLGSLKLVARVHALVKENAELGEDLAHEEAPDKWSVIDLYKQFIERCGRRLFALRGGNGHYPAFVCFGAGEQRICSKHGEQV